MVRLIRMLAAASFLVAAALGFAAHRASLCTLKAVVEVFSSRRAYLLASFAKAALWATAVTFSLAWLGVVDGMRLRGFDLGTGALFGGLLFGIGAAFNGGCSFSTLAYLADGHVSYLASLVGFAAGLAAALHGAPAPAAVALILPPAGATAVALVALIWAWCLWEIVRLWRSRPRGFGLRLVAEPQYRLSTCALVLGLGGGFLLAAHGSWSYTSVLRDTLGLRPVHAAQGFVAGAALLGMGVSARLRGSFRVRVDGPATWARRAVGGAMMGAGSVLIPGGNTVLVLFGIPSGSPHAVPAYLAILAGVALVVIAFRPPLRVACTGDVCRATEAVPG